MPTTDDQERTDAYARGIVRDLEALEELSALDLEDIPGGCTLVELERYLEEEELEDILEEVRELSPAARELLEELATSGELEETDGDPVRAYLERALELTLHERRSPGEESRTLESVSALVSFGGPNASVRARAGYGERYLEVRVSWGSSSSARTADAPTVSAYLLELGEL